MSQYQQVLAILMRIEESMRTLDLWKQEMPAPEALASQEPFCVDTMNFSQWVQWILLPRLEHMSVQQMALPSGSNIMPMAEEALPLETSDAAELIMLIGELDSALNQ